MNTLPKAIQYEQDDNEEKLFRGCREESRTERYQWWTPNAGYAASYSECGVKSAFLRSDAQILNLLEEDCWTESGLYSGEKLEAILPGLPAALRIETEDEIERDRLWDIAGDDLTNLADLLKNAGFDGMRWIEGDGSDEALLLIVD